MSTLCIVCAMIVTAGMSVRFVNEVSRKDPRIFHILWKGVEILALVWLFNYFA